MNRKLRKDWSEFVCFYKYSDYCIVGKIFNGSKFQKV